MEDSCIAVLFFPSALIPRGLYCPSSEGKGGCSPRTSAASCSPFHPLVPAQATDVCGDKLTCYFLGTRLNFSALPIPVPLLRFLPPQSHCDLRGKAKDACSL